MFKEEYVKPSRYSSFISIEDGKKLAFNSSSAALAEIDPDTWRVVQRILADPDGSASSERQDVFDHLKEGKFLIDDEWDEVTHLRVENRLRRYGNSTYFLTVAPTLACNLACPYCYQGHRAESMTREGEQALIQFSERHLKKSDDVVVTWFGGEPTLCMATIERLQPALHEMAARYDATFYPSSIVTNGYLLNGNLARRLNAVGVTQAQVTLDGPRQVHDRRRRLRNGEGTFETIAANLQESVEHLKVVIRVNVDRDNQTDADEVLAELEARSLLSHTRVYFSQVNATDGVCADMRDRCFSTEEFARLQVQWYRSLIGRGYTQIEYPSLAPGGHCGADSDNAFVVSPAGYLFKCWEEVSPDPGKSVGNIFAGDQTPAQKANLYRYLAWDPFEKPGCVTCDVLPLCMGGCPHHGMAMNSDDTGYCCSWKYNLQEMVVLRYLCDQQKEVRA